jgi:hypothetical protein
VKGMRLDGHHGFRDGDVVNSEHLQGEEGSDIREALSQKY